MGKIEKALEQLKKELIATMTQMADVAINTSAQEYVCPEIKELLREHINEDVYDVYDPTEYKRRKNFGGLIDYTNIDVKYDPATKSFSFRDVAMPKNKIDDANEETLSNMIEHGYGDESEPYNKPRPFLANTKEELESGGKLQKMFDDGFIIAYNNLLKNLK